jgi:hypothetical protein
MGREDVAEGGDSDYGHFAGDLTSSERRTMAADGFDH